MMTTHIQQYRVSTAMLFDLRGCSGSKKSEKGALKYFVSCCLQVSVKANAKKIKCLCGAAAHVHTQTHTYTTYTFIVSDFSYLML